MAVLILKKMGVCQNSPQITRINTVELNLLIIKDAYLRKSV